MEDQISRPRTRSSSSGAINSESQPRILKRPTKVNDLPASRVVQDSDNDKPCLMCGGACGSQITSGNDSIECERCEKWFCLKCSALSLEEFGLFTKMSAAHWYCSPCESKALEAVKTDQVVEDRCKKFLEETKERLERLELVSNKWSKVEELCQRLESNIKEMKGSLQVHEKQEDEVIGLDQEVLTSSVQTSRPRLCCRRA